MRKVEIGPLELNIVMKDRIINGDGRDLLGQIDLDEGEIRLLKGIASSMLRTVLWHEIIHGVMDLYHLNDRDSEVRIDREKLVGSLAYGITDVLKRNSWLVGDWDEQTLSEVPVPA